MTLLVDLLDRFQYITLQLFKFPNYLDSGMTISNPMGSKKDTNKNELMALERASTLMGVLR